MREHVGRHQAGGTGADNGDMRRTGFDGRHAPHYPGSGVSATLSFDRGDDPTGEIVTAVPRNCALASQMRAISLRRRARRLSSTGTIKWGKELGV
jgi:hypothetical protein